MSKTGEKRMESFRYMFSVSTSGSITAVSGQHSPLHLLPTLLCMPPYAPFISTICWVPHSMPCHQLLSRRYDSPTNRDTGSAWP